MHLAKKLAKWASIGLISADQAREILEHEDREHRRSGGRVAWAVASAGGLAVVAGIISLVAALPQAEGRALARSSTAPEWRRRMRTVHHAHPVDLVVHGRSLRQR